MRLATAAAGLSVADVRAKGFSRLSEIDAVLATTESASAVVRGDAAIAVAEENVLDGLLGHARSVHVHVEHATARARRTLRGGRRGS